MAKEKTFTHPPRGHVALLAYDPANDRFRVLEVETDADPNLLVGLGKGSVQAHVGTPSADDFAVTTPGLFVVAHLYGFDGANWDRLGPIWSYYDTYYSSVTLVSDVAGVFNVDLSAVPAGRVLTLSGMCVWRSLNAGQYVRLTVQHAVAYTDLGDVDVPAIGRFYPSPVRPVLKAGDHLRAAFSAATVGEYCIATAFGYLMRVAS